MHDITPGIQVYFTDTKLTTKRKNEDNKQIKYDILERIGFHWITHKKGLYSARVEDALYELPKAIEKIWNPLVSLQSAEDEDFEEEDSDGLRGEREEIFIPWNIIVRYTRLGVFRD